MLRFIQSHYTADTLKTKFQLLEIVLIPEHTLVNPTLDIELKLITSSSESHQYT